MKKKRFFPFGWLPGHWGLSGSTRQIAKLEYEYEPCSFRDIEIAKLKLGGHSLSFENEQNKILRDYGVISDYEFEQNRIRLNFSKDEIPLHLLKVDLEFNKITRKDYEYSKVNLIDDETERAVAKNELDYNYHIITENEYHKNKASLNGEGWVTVVKLGTEDDMGVMELDWNDEFVAELKEAGYDGKDGEEIVDNWLTHLCRSVAVDRFSGIGDFDEQIEQYDMESWERKQRELGIHRADSFKGNKGNQGE